MTSTPDNLTLELIDVHDMVVVHRVFRRELAIIDRLVRGVGIGDAKRAAVVARHARLVLAGLHLHHSGEDELLWPLLLERARPSRELIERMERQHRHVEDLLARLSPAITRWESELRPAVTEEVATTVSALRTALLEHLDEEEAHILPLAARHITQQEWNALGEHGLAAMKKSELPIMCGMILEDASPSERHAMLSAVPAPIRILLRTWGAWRYRRYVTAVRAGL
ncbi:hemerythrin domain-containing protein [Jatrophihabitans telluris]|uniref:Hemerythrin domain-containing protein n=1 Tax=Jatrophihabitans telluris TaxID=2038343 RepID=A0ABY4QV23_9ACTN|nr:hemerythrin domain-containing protein [Jatrophihabitans telluris]UQX87455.1 hemerythrin domain-containing protein [Jatrophihabitans telluris]